MRIKTFCTDRCDIVIMPARSKDAQEHAINGKSEKRDANVVLMRCAPQGALGTIAGKFVCQYLYQAKAKRPGA